MRELNPAPYGYNIHPAALDAALRGVLPGKVSGLSTYGPNRPVSIFLYDTATEIDQAVALAVATAHDPVLLGASKTSLTADGLDSVTITVTAPNPAAAAVILLVSVNGAAPAEWPIPLVNGLGSDSLTALDPATITISLKAPGNRSSDILTIHAG